MLVVVVFRTTKVRKKLWIASIFAGLFPNPFRGWIKSLFRAAKSLLGRLNSLFAICGVRDGCLADFAAENFEPLVGFEPTTPRLQITCSGQLKRRVGKLTTSRRYDLLPLLRSSPGGFTGSWPYRTYPFCGCKGTHFFYICNSCPYVFSFLCIFVLGRFGCIVLSSGFFFCFISSVEAEVEIFLMNVRDQPKHRMKNKVSKLLRLFHLAPMAISPYFIAFEAYLHLRNLRSNHLHSLVYR